MATPSYFSPIKVGPPGRQQIFIGGPRGANNPTRELLKEASAVFGKEKLVTQIISIGCGRLQVYSMRRNTEAEGVGRSVQAMAADCEAVDKDLSMRFCDMDAYLRLNVERGMENLVMNEWDDLGPIETHTSAYVETAEVSEAIEASLRRLQRGVGTITLGEISAYRYSRSVVLSDSFTDGRQIIQGTPRTCKTSSRSKRRIWIVPPEVLKTMVIYIAASHEAHGTSFTNLRRRRLPDP